MTVTRAARRGRRLVPALIVALIALAALGTTGASAAPHHAAAKGGKLIVAPKRGQLIDANVAKLSIRAGGSTRVRLNGRWIPARDFSRARHGIRSLQASLSYGLRPGPNTLTVKMKLDGEIQRASVRFRVKPPAPLLGAGTDEVAGTGDEVRLAGQTEAGGDRGSIGWTPIRIPGQGAQSCAQPASRAQRRSPAGLSAAFRPSVPGEYVYRLKSGSGAGAVADTTVATIVEPNHMVPVDTMTAGRTEPAANRGIRVGRSTYLLSNAQGPESARYSGLQVLVLKRNTLECVSNRRYRDASELKTDLQVLDSSYLVIVAMQPHAAPQVDSLKLGEALGRIGYPSPEDGAPITEGSFSMIGVPGMPHGDANAYIQSPLRDEDARMEGNFLPDQYANYGYVPSLSEPIDFAARGPQTCGDDKSDCEANTGYTLTVLDGHTGAKLSEKFFATGNPKVGEAETAGLVEAIKKVADDDVVELSSSSRRTGSESSFAPPMLAVKQPLYRKLEDAIASVGGTRNGFNRTSRAAGVPASGGQTYFLVGWKGAKEGEGAEAAAGVFGQGAAPVLHGILRPDRESLLRPALESDITTGLNLPEVMMWKPTQKWPLEDDPAAMKAFAFLGEKFPQKLGAEPRTSYWELNLEPSKWESMATAIRAIGWDPSFAKEGFEEPEFGAARKQLADELDWVANAREYLTNLAEPFNDNALRSWAQVQTIEQKIYAEAQASEEDTSFKWVELTSILLKLAGPLTAHISNTFGELLDLEKWAFGPNENGLPGYTEVNLKSTELGIELMNEMISGAKTYRAMLDVIVSDPKKLEKIGILGNCKKGSKECGEFAFSPEDEIQVSADLFRSIQRIAYEKLLPTSYDVYRLNRDPQPQAVGGRPRDPVDYACDGFYHPWGDYEFRVRKWTFAALLEEQDVEGGGLQNRWQLLAIGTPPAHSEHDYAPSWKVLNRMFSPVPKSNDNPEEEGEGIGLGMSAEEFLAKQKPWTFWAQVIDPEIPLEACHYASPSS
jgi:hypothetical protein